MGDDTLADTVTEAARRGGDRGEQAAVRFLGRMGLLTSSTAWIDDETGVIEWHAIDYTAPHLSGGQFAAWRLAYSMVHGDIGRNYWRLDIPNRAFFIAALISEGHTHEGDQG